jgi:8-oxo-dGTP diphosphatase
VTMKKQRIYCSYCGNTIISKEQDGKLRDFCPPCNTFYYENPLPVACTIVVNDKREVLLVQRKKDPYQGMWCLPIGFAETGEEVREAALRELCEEAGITGEIIRLIDVDTIDNYFYGSLAIVTYEVRKTGGAVCPGDDATDARYFPIAELPELAWSSNKKAIEIYIELYKDSWAMLDSFRQLYPEINAVDSLTQVTNEQKHFLSNVLIKILGTDNEEITKKWSYEIAVKVPKLEHYLEILKNINDKILLSLQKYLQGEIRGNDYSEFIQIGAELKKSLIPLPDLLTALALSRKTIWTHVIKKRILASPLEIYTTLELNNRIIFIYDRIIYFIAQGYGV